MISICSAYPQTKHTDVVSCGDSRNYIVSMQDCICRAYAYQVDWQRLLSTGDLGATHHLRMESGLHMLSMC
jgi:hypothetical protein